RRRRDRAPRRGGESSGDARASGARGGPPARAGGAAGRPPHRRGPARSRRLELRADLRDPWPRARHGPITPASRAHRAPREAGEALAMTCPDARELLSALLDGALTEDERRAATEHLESCADCARERDRLFATIALLGSVTPVRAPAGFVDRVLDRTRS